MVPGGNRAGVSTTPRCRGQPRRGERCGRDCPNMGARYSAKKRWLFAAVHASTGSSRCC